MYVFKKLFVVYRVVLHILFYNLTVSLKIHLWSSFYIGTPRLGLLFLISQNAFHREIVTTEHETEHWALLNVGPCVTTQVIGPQS